jgi:D-amino peptidase
MAGANSGVLAHSQSFGINGIAINGREVGEIGQVAAIAGYFQIPVIMLAGDRAACDELVALQPKAIVVGVRAVEDRWARGNGLRIRSAGERTSPDLEARRADGAGRV